MRQSLIVFILFLISASTFAQGFEISPIVGWHTRAKLKYAGGELRMKDGINYGFNATVVIQEENGIEFSWLRQESDLTIRDVALNGEVFLSEMTIDYYMIGGLRQQAFDKLVPFGGFQLGAVVFRPKNINEDLPRLQELDNRTNFAVGLTLGLKYMASDRIGLRIEGRMLMPVQYGGFYVGIGTGGSSGGVSVSSTIIQGAFSGGIVIHLGN